jgi:hypothetical protein
MRSNKRFSSVPFTKRVDYDGGAHREPRGARGLLVCEVCRAVYSKKRWIQRDDRLAQLLAPMAHEVLCPACTMAAKGLARGSLRLEGAFFVQHRSDIEALLKGEADRAALDNPTARILGWDATELDALTVTTSTEHLVERLGHAVNRAYGGTIDYGFSHANKLARASWRRD